MGRLGGGPLVPGVRRAAVDHRRGRTGARPVRRRLRPQPGHRGHRSGPQGDRVRAPVSGGGQRRRAAADRRGALPRRRFPRRRRPRRDRAEQNSQGPGGAVPRSRPRRQGRSAHRPSARLRRPRRRRPEPRGPGRVGLASRDRGPARRRLRSRPHHESPAAQRPRARPRRRGFELRRRRNAGRLARIRPQLVLAGAERRRRGRGRKRLPDDDRRKVAARRGAAELRRPGRPEGQRSRDAVPRRGGLFRVAQRARGGPGGGRAGRAQPGAQRHLSDHGLRRRLSGPQPAVRLPVLVRLRGQVAAHRGAGRHGRSRRGSPRKW